MSNTIAIPYASEKTTNTSSLRYLFITFLRIGAVSFGGYMALVAMIQRELVDKDKAIDAAVLAEGISIASLLPGPLAVNIVAYIGYRLRRNTGAAIAVIAVLLPAVLAMLILSWAYFRFAFATRFNGILLYTSGTVSGLIISTGWQFYKKDVKGSWVKIALCAVSFALLILLKGYLVTILLIVAGGCVGSLLKLHGAAKQGDQVKSESPSFFNVRTLLTTLTLALIAIGYVTNAGRYIQNLYAKIAVVFSGISLSLFGGGYVMIPIMQSLLVNDLHWVSSREFLDGITFSQITPGPILVSSIFVGFKLAGVIGAVIALVATFAPSAVLMITVSKFYTAHQHHNGIKNILAGIKPVVTGLILASAIKLLQTLPLNWALLSVCALTFFVALKYKISPVYLIIASLLLGTFLTFLSL